MRLFTKSKSTVLPERRTDTGDTFKTVIIFALLSCLLFDPMVGTFTCLHYKKIMIKKEVKRHIIKGMDKDEMVLLKFSKKETQTKLRWSHPGEFEYNRRMYDIVETKTVGNTVYYWCWYDHEETMLNRQLEEVADQALGKNPKVKKGIAPLIPYFKILYCMFSFNGNVSIPELRYNQVDLYYHLYSQIFIQPPTPPPQLS